MNKLNKLADKFEKKYAMAKPKMPVYLAVFLDADNKQKLLHWWQKVVSYPLLDNIFAHHMTVKFSPKQVDMDQYQDMIGKTVQLKVVGYAQDENGQAVKISTNDITSSNDNPHITISTATGVKPVYSNELLSNGAIPIDGPILTGIFDTFPRSME